MSRTDSHVGSCGNINQACVFVPALCNLGDCGPKQTFATSY